MFTQPNVSEGLVNTGCTHFGIYYPRFLFFPREVENKTSPCSKKIRGEAFMLILKNIYKKSAWTSVLNHPIQLRKVVMIPVLIKSTNMAPMIGTIKNGFTV